MSILGWLGTWLRLWAKPARRQQEADEMTLRDWADLPVHHPCVDNRLR